jgi:hypothetical protein
MALPKRTAPAQKPIDPLNSWVDPEFSEGSPALHSFLLDTQYADGTRRLTGSISLFTKQGVLTAAVNDNDRLLVAYVTACTFGELLFKINEGIEGDTLDWKCKSPPVQNKQIPF